MCRYFQGTYERRDLTYSKFRQIYTLQYKLIIVIEYVNGMKEFFPLSVAQIFWLFQFTDPDVKNYEFKEFVKKFYYQISEILHQNEHFFRIDIFSLNLLIKDSISCYSTQKDDDLFEESSSSDEDKTPQKKRNAALKNKEQNNSNQEALIKQSEQQKQLQVNRFYQPSQSKIFQQFKSNDKSILNLRNTDILKPQIIDDNDDESLKLSSTMTMPNLKQSVWSESGFKTSRNKKEDCDLSDNEEEKKVKIQGQVQKSKAFLSVANIMNSRNTDLTKTLNFHSQNNLGTEKALKTFSLSMPQLVLRKLDQSVIKNNVLKARGFLLRKSMKYKQKWTYNFYYIDINKFVREGTKVLKSFRPKVKIFDNNFLDMIEMRRAKINENQQLLLIPYKFMNEAVIKTNNQANLQKYLCLRYVYEERILNDVLDIFKEAQYFEQELKHKVTNQVYFKVVLDACDLKYTDYQKVQNMTEEQKLKMFDKQSYQKMLLCIDSGRLMIFTLKKKDEINLQDCEVELISKLGISENNKYMFQLNFKKRGIFTQKMNKLVLGTDSDSSRRDWVFTMQLSRKFQSKMRDSILYITELKKLSILQITMEKQEEMRKSMSRDGKFLQTMKKQAQDIDLPLQFQETPKNQPQGSKIKFDDTSNIKDDLQNEIDIIQRGFNQEDQPIQKKKKQKKKSKNLDQNQNKQGANQQQVQGGQRDQVQKSSKTIDSHRKQTMIQRVNQTSSSNPYLSAEESDNDVISSDSESDDDHDEMSFDDNYESSQDSKESSKNQIADDNGFYDKSSSIFRSQILEDPQRPTNKKGQPKLKRVLKYQLLEYEVVGKSPQLEIVGESNQNLLLRFLIHFLFTKHNSFELSLIEKNRIKEIEKNLAVLLISARKNKVRQSVRGPFQAESRF
ncbi:UNKNOWN [Stylonychia lemnae]|uniref:PH domain-containing protein n=1 Tax=Stylonychia lemnae TaxID=5949 RepID=A0A078AGR6_STYLE|nr:UNKNOWN [Stylonychia lemnae]|eukprot:CDW81036.1 UNKNOWN [Stylonychia lemnae]